MSNHFRCFATPGSKISYGSLEYHSKKRGTAEGKDSTMFESSGNTGNLRSEFYTNHRPSRPVLEVSIVSSSPSNGEHAGGRNEKMMLFIWSEIRVELLKRR